jgi:hypothetical protein
MRWEVALQGGGRVQLAAYGMADAEHQVEKELAELCPGARADILEVARTGSETRIVEEFAVRYRLQATVAVDAETEDDARRAARRQLNDRLAGTRYARITWDSD